MSPVSAPPTSLADLTVPPPEGPDNNDWNSRGVVLLENEIGPEYLDPYAEEWIRSNAWEQRPHGWPSDTPYMANPALRRLCCHPGIGAEITRLLGRIAGVHLNLTGWVSTERRWHQDGYLNPPEVGDLYAAAWIALDDIHPDSGPFQYVPGSHRWPQITRETIAPYVDLGDPAWPATSQDWVADLFATEIDRRGAEVVTYLPQAGDVLLWHPRLLHQGSAPRVPGMRRPALIAHYSGTGTRPWSIVRHEAGGYYYSIP